MATDATLTSKGQMTIPKAIRDGLGMKSLQATGVELAIITSRRSTCVARRAENLGIELLFQGIEHKLTAFQQLAASLGLEARHCAYMGDDFIDAPAIKNCLSRAVTCFTARKKSAVKIMSQLIWHRSSCRAARCA